MAKSEYSVLDVLLPDVRSRLLRLLFTATAKPLYVRELMVRSGLALHTVQDELRKLSVVGLVKSRSSGRCLFYAANQDHLLYPHLLKIVQLDRRLPCAKYSALQRPRRRRASKDKGRKPSPLRPDRAMSWHLFSPRKSN